MLYIIVPEDLNSIYEIDDSFFCQFHGESVEHSGSHPRTLACIRLILTARGSVDGIRIVAGVLGTRSEIGFLHDIDFTPLIALFRSHPDCEPHAFRHLGEPCAAVHPERRVKGELLPAVDCSRTIGVSALLCHKGEHAILDERLSGVSLLITVPVGADRTGLITGPIAVIYIIPDEIVAEKQLRVVAELESIWNCRTVLGVCEKLQFIVARFSVLRSGDGEFVALEFGAPAIRNRCPGGTVYSGELLDREHDILSSVGVRPVIVVFEFDCLALANRD